MSMRHVSIVVAALAGLLHAAGSHAGDLNPPAGPLMPTMLPLNEVEPRTPLSPEDVPIVIAQPGSYFLTGNLRGGGAGATAITVLAENVTIDMRGFEIGPSEVGAFNRGIEVEGDNVQIANGTIRGCLDSGIYAVLGDDGNFENLRLVGNAGFGLITTRDATIRRCIALSNTLAGLRCDSTAVIEGCRAQSNGGVGIQVGARSSVSACVSTQNGAAGYLGGDTSSISNCTAQGNAGPGFSFAAGGASLVNCTARSNSVGFSVGDASVIDGCTASLNTTHGVSVGDGSTVRGCSAFDNTNAGFTATGDAPMFVNCSAQSNEDGFQLGNFRASFESCTAVSNTRYGIDVGNDSVVRNCMTRFNQTGIRATTHGYIIGNTCNRNDVGIEAGVGARIDSNHCAFNGTGYVVASDSYCVRNVSTASDGLPYIFVGGGSTGIAVSSNSGTAGPWHNLE